MLCFIDICYVVNCFVVEMDFFVIEKEDLYFIVMDVYGEKVFIMKMMINFV